MPFAQLELRRPERSVADPAIAVPAAWIVDIDGQLATDRLFVLQHSDDPVQLAHCRHCGTPWCANGGCVLVRRVGESIVWMRPWLEPAQSDDEWGNYVIGGETVWLSAGDIAWMKLRYAPVPAVASHPVWFSLADYGRFLNTLGVDVARQLAEVKALSIPESDFLLRTAVVTQLGLSDPALADWRVLADAATARRVDPADHPAAAMLRAFVANPVLSAPITRVEPVQPEAVCRLFETGAQGEFVRLVAAADGRLWHSVGSGCFGELSRPD